MVCLDSHIVGLPDNAFARRISVEHHECGKARNSQLKIPELCGCKLPYQNFWQRLVSIDRSQGVHRVE